MDLEASKDEIDTFLATLSNPKDAQEYLDKWNDFHANLEEGLDNSDIESLIEETYEVLQ